MKRATREWADKAEGDWLVARRESQASNAVWDAVCFHAQQCAEKYLKAILEEHGITFPKTHDLTVLLALSEGNVPEMERLAPDLAYLTPLAVATRYPGAQADADLATTAVQIAGKVRSICRAALRLEQTSESD